jgi:hypothetical protein
MWSGVLAVVCIASFGAAPAAEADDPPAVTPTVGPVQIPYSSLHRVLTPGATGFLQYSFVGTPATPTTPLSSIVGGWTSVPAMLSIDQLNVPYLPDPTDASSQQLLPKVWDFTGLQTGTLSYRTFNTTRDDTAWDTCLQSCSVKNQTAAPPDGSWKERPVRGSIFRRMSRCGVPKIFSGRCRTSSMIRLNSASKPMTARGGGR